MSYRPVGSKMIYSETSASLAVSGTLDTGWFDCQAIDKIQGTFQSSGVGFSLIIHSSSEPDGSGAAFTTENQITTTNFFVFNSIARQRYMRIIWRNDTDEVDLDASSEIKASYGSSDKLSVFPVNVNPTDFSQAALVQSVTRGQQPDGDFVSLPADGQFFKESGILDSNEVFISDWYDTDGWNAIELYVQSDVKSSGLGIHVQYTDNVQEDTPILRGEIHLEYTQTDVENGFRTFILPIHLDGFRVAYTNAGDAQEVFFMAANARVIRQPNNYNDAGALVVTEYRGEVAQKKIPGKAIDVKFGRNADISTGSIPEDVWIGGGEYQGFNPSISGGQRVSILGGANDTGQVVVSGTTTGGNSDYITVTGGDFLGSGVQNGDVLINDTRNAHGIVTNVTASTVTVFRMDGAWNSSEDKFRIARATGTGAGVVKFKKALRNNFVGEYSEYVVLNGTNPVGSANDEYIRCSRCSVVAAGSNGTNVGAITGRQAVTTANVFFIIGAEDGQTLQCVTTVPAEQTYLIETYITGITRLTGAAGAATVQFETRKYGESWVVLRSFDLQTGARINIDENGGTVLCGGTDIRCRVTRVSDNSTVIDASLEYLVTMIPDREVEL